MPNMPIGEMFRSFKAPAGWGGHYLEPDLTAYGLLKEQNSALFVEYDGYYRHATREGVERDLLKNTALLEFAPAGSFVVRICHKGKTELHGHVLWVCVNSWRQGNHLSLTGALRITLQETVARLRPALHPDAYRSLKAHLGTEQSLAISQAALESREAILQLRRGNTAEEMSIFFKTQGFIPEDIGRMQKQALGNGVSIEQVRPRLQFLFQLGLTRTQITKVLATYPPILGLSIEQTLKPTVQWFVDLGLTKGQIAKAVATFPQILAYSIEKNLNPTVQWFLNFGLTEGQAAKAVATFPKFLGYSLDNNLKPTVRWFLHLGLAKGQVVKAVATFPPILGLSIERNLKPTVQWFVDLGLTKGQIAKAVATFPQILAYSIEKNLNPTVQWFLNFGLTEGQVAKAVASFPPMLGFSIEQNLKPTVQWLLNLGLSKSQVVQAVSIFPQILGLSVDKNLACKLELMQSFLSTKDVVDLIAKWPPIFSYRQQRLEERLNVLADLNSLGKLAYAMRLTNEVFHKRFVAPKKSGRIEMNRGEDGLE